MYKISVLLMIVIMALGFALVLTLQQGVHLEQKCLRLELERQNLLCSVDRLERRDSLRTCYERGLLDVIRNLSEPIECMYIRF